eukprot:764624-Hanusia_phi.AAC.2
MLPNSVGRQSVDVGDAARELGRQRMCRAWHACDTCPRRPLTAVGCGRRLSLGTGPLLRGRSGGLFAAVRTGIFKERIKTDVRRRRGAHPFEKSLRPHRVTRELCPPGQGAPMSAGRYRSRSCLANGHLSRLSAEPRYPVGGRWLRLEVLQNHVDVRDLGGKLTNLLRQMIQGCSLQDRRRILEIHLKYGFVKILLASRVRGILACNHSFHLSRGKFSVQEVAVRTS